MQILVHKIAAKIFQTGLYANKLIKVTALIKVKTCTQTSEGMKRLKLSIKHGYALEKTVLLPSRHLHVQS